MKAKPPLTAQNIVANTAEIVTSKLSVELPAPTQKLRTRMIGQWTGRGWIADDFETPLEDFKGYME